MAPSALSRSLPGPFQVPRRSHWGPWNAQSLRGEAGSHRVARLAHLPSCPAPTANPSGNASRTGSSKIVGKYQLLDGILGSV